MSISQGLEDNSLRRLFWAAMSGIAVLDIETGIVTDVNPFLIKMLGYVREEWVGRQLTMVDAFKDLAHPHAMVNGAGAREVDRPPGLPLRAKDGRQLWVELVCRARRVGAQHVALFIFNDITRHRQLPNK